MKLKLVRRWYTNKSTIGELYIGESENSFCFTLEDALPQIAIDIHLVWNKTNAASVRQLKKHGETAIPFGEYEVALTWSNKFKRFMPLIMNVPLYEGVRIHSGNRPEDTEGCLLVGKIRGEDFVGRSREAFGELFPLLEVASIKEKILLAIVNNEK